ncbi:MAG: NACHT domain-containing protein [Oxalobacteraceae bacterium]|nr:MAG: NACHT domain-containing protein [Oxalobacteraceae bacterium]
MAAITAAVVTASARLLSPLVADLYKGAKGQVQEGMRRWQETGFARKLARKIHSLELVKTLWSPEDEVSLLKFYYPASIRGIDRKNGRLFTSVEDLGEGNLVIQGIVGQGKSILLRYIAIGEAVKKDPCRLPIFLELRTLSAALPLRKALYQQLAAYDIEVDDASFDHIARSGRATILLDGFDELATDQIKPTLNEIAFLAQKYPESQIIVTSRPGNEIQKLTGFRLIKVAPLTRNDYGPFLTKLGLDATKVFAIREAIKNSPSRIADLITTPLMLTLVVIVYQAEKEIPPTLPEFFEKLFQVVFTRHDRLKPGFERVRHSGLSEKRLQNLFEAFCFMTLQNGFGRSLSPEEFSVAFDQAIEYTDKCACDVEKFRLDIVKVACLMLEEGIDTTTFLHKSVLEYYAAAFIKHSTDEVARLFYDSAPAAVHTWREVVRFLRDIDPYRYSKEFALPEIKAIRTEFFAPLVEKNDMTLVSALRRLHPNFCMTYTRSAEGEDDFDLQGVGPFNGNARMAYESFDELLMSAIERQMPSSMNEGTLSELIQADIEDDDMGHEYEVPIWRIISMCGAQEFWSAVEVFRARLEQLEQEALSIVALHEKRKLIFSPKKSTGPTQN